MGTNKLDIHSPDQIIYSNGLMNLTVLGGIRLDGLDRLRVTLKLEVAESPRPPIRHNLDLYNSTQVEKLIRKAAESLEMGTSTIAASISELTEQLEIYRLEEIKNRKPEEEKVKPLTPEQQQAAETFLKSPGLLERTNGLIGESGVIGEELNRLIMYLVFTSRKREMPLHVVSLASSGTGKTHLQEKVGQLIPENERVEITTLSENAFYYFGQRELKHRVILIEDLDGAESVLYPMRELMSKRKISKTIAHKNNKGETKTIHLIVEGPVSVAGCTTQETIYEDNANRSFLLYLDESQEQDAKIMAYQRALSAGKVDHHKERAAAELLRNCQKILQPVKVINPYAEQLKIPIEVFKPRRSNAHYLAFIEVITFYHQYQREQKVEESTGEIYIETTLDDISAANRLLKEILLRKSDELSGACRNYFEHLKMYLLQEKKQTFTSKEIRNKLRIPGTTFRRHQNELLNSGYIKIRGGKKETGYQYEIVSYEEYHQLRAGIETVLEEVLKQLKHPGTSAAVQPKKAATPAVSQSVNGSAKPQEINTHTPVSHEKQEDVPANTKNLNPGAQGIYDALVTLTQKESREYVTSIEISKYLNRNLHGVNRHLKTLTDMGKVEREWKELKYLYKIKQP